MSDSADHDEDDDHGGHEHHGGHDDHADHEHHPHETEYATERTTAPQSAYTVRDVGVGFVVALTGMAVVFAVPLLLA